MNTITGRRRARLNKFWASYAVGVVLGVLAAAAVQASVQPPLWAAFLLWPIITLTVTMIAVGGYMAAAVRQGAPRHRADDVR